MALKPCRECGQEVSPKAKTCPSCGIKTPVRQMGAGALVLLGVVAIGFVSVLSSGESAIDPNYRSPPPAPRVPDPPLSASVNFDGAQFVITNSDSFAWANCKLDLNGGLIRRPILDEAAELIYDVRHRRSALHDSRTGRDRDSTVLR